MNLAPLRKFVHPCEVELHGAQASFGLAQNATTPFPSFLLPSADSPWSIYHHPPPPSSDCKYKSPPPSYPKTPGPPPELAAGAASHHHVLYGYPYVLGKGVAEAAHEVGVALQGGAPAHHPRGLVRPEGDVLRVAKAAPGVAGAVQEEQVRVLVSRLPMSGRGFQHVWNVCVCISRGGGQDCFWLTLIQLQRREAVNATVASFSATPGFI